MPSDLRAGVNASAVAHAQLRRGNFRQLIVLGDGKKLVASATCGTSASLSSWAMARSRCPVGVERAP
jgi:hypothetical protein